MPMFDFQNSLHISSLRIIYTAIAIRSDSNFGSLERTLDTNVTVSLLANLSRVTLSWAGLVPGASVDTPGRCCVEWCSHRPSASAAALLTTPLTFQFAVSCIVTPNSAEP